MSQIENPQSDDTRISVRPEPFDDEIDLLSYVEVVVKRRWLIFWIVCAFAAASVAQGIITQKRHTYLAEANALVIELRQIDLATGKLVGRSAVNLKALAYASVGRRVLERRMPCLVEGRPDTVQLWDYLAKGKTIRKALDELEKVVHFSQNGDEILTLTAEMGDSLIAAATVNAFLEELIQYYTEIEWANIRKDVEFLDDRLGVVEQDLRAAEDSLLVFKRKYRGTLNQVDLIDELALEYTWKQLLLTSRSELYGSLLKQKEMIRLVGGRNVLEFEVLNFAQAEDVESVEWSAKTRAGLGGGAGLVIGLFAAFFAEFIDRNRQSGGLDRIVRAYRGGN